MFREQAFCEDSYGLCTWDEDDSECLSADDYCADLLDKQGCGFSDTCVFEEACTDACEACSTCISAFTDFIGDDDLLSVSEVQSVNCRPLPDRISKNTYYRSLSLCVW